MTLRVDIPELERFRALVKQMTWRSKVFAMLKEELSLLGYWKNKCRGNASKGGYAKQQKRMEQLSN